MKYKNRLESSKGAITLYVLIAMTFFSAVVFGIYNNTSFKTQKQEIEINKIQEEYKGKDVNELYEETHTNYINSETPTIQVYDGENLKGEVIGEKVSSKKTIYIPNQNVTLKFLSKNKSDKYAYSTSPNGEKIKVDGNTLNIESTIDGKTIYVYIEDAEGNYSKNYTAVTMILVTLEDKTIYVGEERKTDIGEIKGENAGNITFEQVSDTSIALVESNKINGIKAGTTTFIAKEDKAGATATVTVKVVKIELEFATKTILLGDSKKIKVTGINNGTLSIKSSNTELSTVELNNNNEIIVTAKKEGNVVITVTESNVNYEVDCQIKIASVTLEPNGGIYTMPTEGNATVKTTVTLVNAEKIETTWSNNMEKWNVVENTQLVEKTDCEKGIYYLYVRVNEEEIYKSKEFIVGDNTQDENKITIEPSTTNWTVDDITATVTYGSTLISNKKAGYGKTLLEAKAEASADTANNLTATANGYFYAEATDTAGNKVISSLQVTKIDRTAPTATGYEVKNITTTGYDVYVYGVQDNGSGVNRVQFPTWTDYNGQDDLQSSWSTSSSAKGTKQEDGTTWVYHVKTTDHNYEAGTYYTYVYAYDNVGNGRYIYGETITVPTVKITYNENYNSVTKIVEKPYNTKLGTLSTPTRAGYTFVGWFTDTIGGTQISSSTLTPENDTTYYAHWTVNQYSVTCEDWFVDASNNRKVKIATQTAKNYDYGSTAKGSDWGTSDNGNYRYHTYTEATVGTSGATVYRYYYVWVDVNIYNPSGSQDNKSAYFSLSNDNTNWDTNLTNESSKTNNLPWGTVIYIKDLVPYYEYYEYDKCSGCTYSNSQWTYTVTGPNTMHIWMKYKSYNQDLNYNVDGQWYYSGYGNRIQVGLKINGVDKGYCNDFGESHKYGTPWEIYGVKLDGVTLTQYNSTGTVGTGNSLNLTFYTLSTTANNESYGSTSPTSLIVWPNETYSTNGNILTISDGRTSTASTKSVTGYTTKFAGWSSTSGTITSKTTVTANFTAADETAPTAPTIVAKLNDANGATYSSKWTNNNVYVKLTSTEQGSGIQQYEWNEDGTWKTTSLTTSSTGIGEITFTSEINKTIKFRVKDKAGNISGESPISIKIDKTEPTRTLNPNGGTFTVPTSGNATIKTTIVVSDSGGSEFNTLQYAWSINNTTEPTSWSNFTNLGLVSKTDCTAGTYYLWTKITDNAGNKAINPSNGFIVSASTITITPSKTSWTNTDVTATVSYGSNLTSNRKAGYGTSLSAAQTAASTSTTTSLTATANGYFYAEATDSMGNKVTKSFNVTIIDKTPPTNSAPSITIGQHNIRVMSNSTDSGSGLDKYKFSIDGGSTYTSYGTNDDKAFNPKTEGKAIIISKIRVKIKDKVGNERTVQPTTVYRNKTVQDDSTATQLQCWSLSGSTLSKTGDVLVVNREYPIYGITYSGLYTTSPKITATYMFKLKSSTSASVYRHVRTSAFF